MATIIILILSLACLIGAALKVQVSKIDLLSLGLALYVLDDVVRLLMANG